MAEKRRPTGERSSSDILREMEEISQSIESSISQVSESHRSEESAHSSPESEAPRKGGAFKSLLGLFVTMDPESSVAPSTDSAAPHQTSPEGQASGPRVSDLVAGEQRPQFAVPSGAGAGTADLSQKPLEEIYSEAQLSGTPCSVDELAQLLENPTIASQPMSIKVVAVNLALSAKGVGVDVPIADAVRRDRAMDAFQGMLDERARAAEERNAAQIQLLTREAEEYLKQKQAEMDALRAETEEAKRQSVDFALRREKEEKRLAELISPFLEGKPSPVTVGIQSGKQP